jgi:DNA-binding XRE family transcriptional regulator
LVPGFREGEVSGAMPAPAPGSLGCLLREVRERQGLTREVLAGISGVSVTTISELELGITVRPHRATVRKLADALGLSGDELASFEEAAGAACPPAGPGGHRIHGGTCDRGRIRRPRPSQG